MDNTSAEFEKFLLWFTNLEEIPIYTRRDFLAHVMEIGGIDEKAAQFIDDTLAHLEDNQNHQIAELDRVNGVVQSLADKTPEMEEQDIRNAEVEMQRIADKFCNEFREQAQKKNKEEESDSQENDAMLEKAIRGDI
jgi:adenylyl- and sulfurtransferase ThiI